MKRLLLIAGFCLFGAGSVLAAPKFPVAADGTTNIADCAKAPADVRFDCIGKARPLTGQQVYSTYGAAKATAAAAGSDKAAAAVEKAKRRAAEKAARLAEVRYNKARVASAPKGLKVNSDGTTNIADCAKASPAVRNECISRARPMNAKALSSFTAARTAAYARVAAAQDAAAKKAVAAKASAQANAKVVTKAVAKAAAPAAAPILNVKGFVIAKDGTTNVADCAKAKPEFKNECISRARPLTGAQIYGRPSGRRG